MMSRSCRGMGVAVFLVLAMSARADDLAAFLEVPTPSFRTEVIAFEDTFLYPTPADGSLIYRTEGPGQQVRRTDGPRRGLMLSGETSCIHVAQYNRAAVRISVRIVRGEPAIAIAHNGMRDRLGHLNPSPGVEIVLKEKTTVLRDLSNGRDVATVPRAFPRGSEGVLTIAWDCDERWLRIDLPGHSFLAPLPARVTRKGGFALRSPASPATSYLATRVRVLWQDQRDLVLYDGYSACFDAQGRKLGSIPPPELPAGQTDYATAAIDLQRERTLICYGGHDLNSSFIDTIKGWAVRELKTGKLRLFGLRVNGCLPMQGGGGIDGIWALQSWNVPASISWLDWNAYERGDLAHFVVPAMTAQKGPAAGAYVGFHDPCNALDGSIVRYLRITENGRGVNHFTVHPDLAAYAPFTDVAMPPPAHPLVSHTGPAGMPVQLVVRDRDRAWYEEWAFLGNALHTQCRGYNVFTRQDDWAGPFYPPEKGAAAYEDFVNMMPDLVTPGRLMAPLTRFDPRAEPSKTIVGKSTYWLRAGADHFVVEGMAFEPGWPIPSQILMDIASLRRD